MRSLFVFGIVGVLAAAPGAQAPQPVEALDGVDTVVLLQQGKEVFGKSEYSVDRGRFRYLFSSAETKATFEGAPEKYEIQLGGLCARMGKTASGNPSDYVVHDGKIYIFGSDECHQRFAAAPEKYLEKPAPPMPSSPDAARRGRELIERAVEALGGAQKVDAVRTYAESTSQVQHRNDGDVTVTARTIWRFPNEMRIERSMQRPGMPVTFATVLTPAAMWVASQGRTFPMIDAARPALEFDAGRHPLALLKARRNAGFEAAALEHGSVDGTAVDRVRVRYRAVDATLGVDPASGRIHSIEFTDRNIGGEIGGYTLLFGDYRADGGLLLPHTVRALFNGQPDTFLSSTVQSIEVNPSIDAALFERPVAAERK
jgi:YHS domain-containing protein